ncbi:hypothetical protein [Pigmentiphaga sp. YJ18]|uniref:hypothetical protein n=1 Tax=Pigmentiphaga sp. YJ18 TaxID=3134907 RepID=UPI004053FE36
MSPTTAHKWQDHLPSKGDIGLVDRSSRSIRSCATDEKQLSAIAFLKAVVVPVLTI